MPCGSTMTWLLTALLPFGVYLVAVNFHSTEKLEEVCNNAIRLYLPALDLKKSENVESIGDVAPFDSSFNPFPIMPAHVEDWKFHSRRKVRPPDPFPLAVETESNALLQHAKQMYTNGRLEKAQRLFKRAIQLAPRSADALSAYGEFLHKEKNPLEAEKLLAKALLVRPDHADAQRVHNMNAAFVQDMDRSLFVSIDSKRNSLLKVPRDDPAFMRALRENYVRHVYHSNAIEGNTLTLSMVRSILETGLTVAGKSIREHNDVLGLDLALNFVHQSTLKRRQITIEDVISLHGRIMGHSQPLDAGKFRDTQVFVSGHVPPAPKHLDELMSQYGHWLGSADAAALHPIARAAMDHFKLVHIHPFVDGNGRLSRLVMNIRLMQGGYPPVIIPVQERYVYYEKLAMADEGDPRPFIRYIANLTERTIDEYLQFTQKQIDETSTPMPTAAPGEHSTSAESTVNSADNPINTDDIPSFHHL